MLLELILTASDMLVIAAAPTEEILSCDPPKNTYKNKVRLLRATQRVISFRKALSQISLFTKVQHS